MYEVEVKAVLKDRNAVIKKLQEFGCKFGEELHQIDHVFVPEKIVFPPPLGTNVLRVRKQGGISFLTLKISQSNNQDSFERELKIEDGDKMIEIIKLLGYKEVPTVEKRRIKTNFKDMEIVLDKVEQLGEFIEVEKIVNNESQSERNNIQAELIDFMEILGISRADQVINGKYDIMLFNKLNMV